MLCFGETCLAKLTKNALSTDEVPKLAARWCRAVFVGYDRETNEYVLHTQGRLLKTRAIQRLTKEKRWSSEALQEIEATPYSMYRKPELERIFMRDPSLEVEERLRGGRQQWKTARDIRLYERDFIAHGYTAHGCERCGWALQYGWAMPCTSGHSKECRDRMREAIRSSGEPGRKRVEDNELRRHQKAERSAATAAEGEQEGQEGRDGDRGMVAHRFDEFDFEAPEASGGTLNTQMNEHNLQDADHPRHACEASAFGGSVEEPTYVGALASQDHCYNKCLSNSNCGGIAVCESHEVIVPHYVRLCKGEFEAGRGGGEFEAGGRGEIEASERTMCCIHTCNCPYAKSERRLRRQVQRPPGS